MVTLLIGEIHSGNKANCIGEKHQGSQRDAPVFVEPDGQSQSLYLTKYKRAISVQVDLWDSPWRPM